MNREPINIYQNDAQYETFNAHQDKYVKDNDIHTHFLFIYGLQ